METSIHWIWRKYIKNKPQSYQKGTSLKQKAQNSKIQNVKAA